MREYGQATDEELIDRLRDGEEDITEYLIDKYKYLVRSKAATMYILGADRDDLIQEGMIGLFKAIRDFDSGRDASFFTFAELCVSRQMYSAVQAAGRQKHMPLNTYVSIQEDGGPYGDGEKNGTLGSVADSGLGPEETVIDRENVEQLERLMEQELSPFEKQVLDLYLTGMSYTQIAKVLGRDEKSTDNALQRLKAKIRKILVSR